MSYERSSRVSKPNYTEEFVDKSFKFADDYRYNCIKIRLTYQGIKYIMGLSNFRNALYDGMVEFIDNNQPLCSGVTVFSGLIEFDTRVTITFTRKDMEAFDQFVELVMSHFPSTIYMMTTQLVVSNDVGIGTCSSVLD